jgi:hypothetical protein
MHLFRMAERDQLGSSSKTVSVRGQGPVGSRDIVKRRRVQGSGGSGIVNKSQVERKSPRRKNLNELPFTGVPRQRAHRRRVGKKLVRSSQSSQPGPVIKSPVKASSKVTSRKNRRTRWLKRYCGIAPEDKRARRLIGGMMRKLGRRQGIGKFMKGVSASSRRFPISLRGTSGIMCYQRQPCKGKNCEFSVAVHATVCHFGFTKPVKWFGQNGLSWNVAIMTGQLQAHKLR